MKINLLEGGWENNSPQAKSSLLPAFINKALLEHSYVHSFTHGLWTLSPKGKLSICDLDYMTGKA